MTGALVRRAITGAVVAGLVAPGLVARAFADDPYNGPPTHSGPCVLSWDSKTSNDDPDVDITRTVLRLTPSALIVTIKVAKLADHPRGYTGHRFQVSVGFGGPYGRDEVVTAEYTHDDVSGTSTYDPDNQYQRDLRGTSVRFDTGRSEVVATIPRHALYAQMVQPKLQPSVVVAGVDSLGEPSPLGGTGADSTWTRRADGSPLLSFAACDRHLGNHPTPAPLDPGMNHVGYPDACTAAVTDPQGDAQERHDLDITSVTFRYRAHDVKVTMGVPAMADHPAEAWQQVFAVGSRSPDGGESDPPFPYVGYQRSSAGNGTVGSGPLLGGGIDELHHRVVFRLRRGPVLDSGGLYVFTSDRVIDVTRQPTGFDRIAETAQDKVDVRWVIDPSSCTRTLDQA